MQWESWSRADKLVTAVKDWLAQPGPALLHVHVNPMQLVMPPFTQVEPAIGMALYSTRAILHGRGGDVWEMVQENFLWCPESEVRNICGILFRELRIRKDTSKFMILVWFWFRSSLGEFAATMERTSEPPH
jgi:hypothetical protein